MEADLADLKSYLAKEQRISTDQVSEINAKKEKLQTSAQALFTKMYEQALQAAGAQGCRCTGGPDMGQAQQQAAPEDDEVDGDFRRYKIVAATRRTDERKRNRVWAVKVCTYPLFER